MVIQGTFGLAVQGQPVATVTAICPGPPAGVAEPDTGFNVNLQSVPEPLGCVIGKLTLPIVIDPLRELLPV